MKASKPIAFVILAFLVGGIASQLPFAFADSSANPLQSIWDAIDSLSNKQEDLQAQIDQLRGTIEKDHAGATESQSPQSEPSVEIKLEGGEEPSSVIIHLMASNAGPDNAVGVKVTLFYEMPLLEIRSMSGEQCENLSRGIIQCFIGTIGANEEYPISVDANTKALGKNSKIVADISSITTDTDPSDNHAIYQFVTGKVPRNVIPAGNENEAKGIGEANNAVQNITDSQTSEAGQSTSTENSAQQNDIGNNSSNSTQSDTSEQTDESSNEKAGADQTQESESQNSGAQNSEPTDAATRC